MDSTACKGWGQGYTCKEQGIIVSVKVWGRDVMRTRLRVRDVGRVWVK